MISASGTVIDIFISNFVWKLKGYFGQEESERAKCSSLCAFLWFLSQSQTICLKALDINKLEYNIR